MVDFADLTDVVFEAIKSYLGDGSSIGAWTSAPINYPNEPFTTPDPPGPFVICEITGTLYAQQSIGASLQEDNRWDEEGQLWLHVMAPVGSGSSAVRGAAKTLANLFRGKTMLNGQIEFLDATLGIGEPGDDNGNYFRVSVSIDWRYWDA